MTTTLPMELPKCPEHSIQMVLRPLVHQTPEQKFCGAWYDCPACTKSVLFQSPALRAQLAEMRNRSNAQAGLWDGLKGSNGEVRGASRPAGEASSREAATSTVLLGTQGD